MYPTVDEFTSMLGTLPLEEIASTHVLDGQPFVFRDDSATYQLLLTLLSQGLGVRADQVRVVGSARIGFSLNPARFPRAFGDESDIDIVVIDEKSFDLIWQTLLAWNYPRRYRLVGSEHRWQRRRQDDVYWGWFRPDQLTLRGLKFPETLVGLRDMGTRWFDCFQSLSLHPQFSARTVSGRLYRTEEHALRYHESGLRRLRDQLEIVLDLSLDDLLALAGYAQISELPDFEPYLRAKHGDLPETAITQLVGHFELIADKHRLKTEKEEAA